MPKRGRAGRGSNRPQGNGRVGSAVIAIAVTTASLPTISTSSSSGIARAGTPRSGATRRSVRLGNSVRLPGWAEQHHGPLRAVQQVPDEQHHAEEHADGEPATELHEPGLAPEQPFDAQLRTTQPPRGQKHEDDLGGEHRVVEEPVELVFGPVRGVMDELDEASHTASGSGLQGIREIGKRHAAGATPVWSGWCMRCWHLREARPCRPWWVEVCRHSAVAPPTLGGLIRARSEWPSSAEGGGWGYTGVNENRNAPGRLPAVSARP